MLRCCDLRIQSRCYHLSVRCIMHCILQKYAVLSHYKHRLSVHMHLIKFLLYFVPFQLLYAQRILNGIQLDHTLACKMQFWSWLIFYLLFLGFFLFIAFRRREVLERSFYPCVYLALYSSFVEENAGTKCSQISNRILSTCLNFFSFQFTCSSQRTILLF